MIGEFDRENLKTGFKEVMNVLSENRAAKVFVAEDSEDKIKLPVTEAAKNAGIEVEFAESRKVLGKMCGIDVGASCAAIIK